MLHLVSGIWLAAAVLAPPHALSLDGWGIFKFDMSPEQIRALPGFTFGRYTIDASNSGAMGSKNPVAAFGASDTLNLYFNSFHALNEIGLQNEQTTSRSGCDAAFAALLAELEKAYGPLAPVYPEQKKNASDLLPISIVWKNSSGASRYQLATVFLPGETAYVWNARRLYGRRYLDMATAWSGEHDNDKAVCLTELDFKA